MISKFGEVYLLVNYNDLYLTHKFTTLNNIIAAKNNYFLAANGDVYLNIYNNYNDFTTYKLDNLSNIIKLSHSTKYALSSKGEVFYIDQSFEIKKLKLQNIIDFIELIDIGYNYSPLPTWLKLQSIYSIVHALDINNVAHHL